MKLKQIIEAWLISNNPTNEQKVLAEKRGEICYDCDKKNIYLDKFAICSECGCPINKKIFTNDFNPCPLKKWEDVDTLHFGERKNIKTLL